MGSWLKRVFLPMGSWLNKVFLQSCLKKTCTFWSHKPNAHGENKGILQAQLVKIPLFSQWAFGIWRQKVHFFLRHDCKNAFFSHMPIWKIQFFYNFGNAEGANKNKKSTLESAKTAIFFLFSKWLRFLVSRFSIRCTLPGEGMNIHSHTMPTYSI